MRFCLGTNVWRWVGAALLLAALPLLWPSPAAAHTGFDSSDPADGDVVVEPVTDLVIRFSGPAAPTGEGFVVRLPTGEVALPTAVVEDDGNTWRLVLPELVTDGVVAVRWEVKAPDAHPIAGSFSFTVAAVGSAPDEELAAERATTERESLVVPEAPVTSAPRPVVGAEVSAASPTVDEFLVGPDRGAAGASLLGYVGRFLGLGGTVAAVGLLAFAMSVLRVSDPEREGLIRFCEPIGALILVGVVCEAVAQAVGAGPWAMVSEGSSWAWVFGSNAGTAVLLRSVGGGALVGGVWHTRGPSRTFVESRAAQLVPDVRPAAEAPVDPSEQRAHDPVERSDGTSGSPLLLVGVGLLLTAMVFDGHTVTSGQWLTTALVDVVHVSASGVWAGGVLGLTAVLVHRHRRGVALEGLRLGIRFSAIAALASAMAGVAGTALAAIVLDDLDELVGTQWGRVLIAKVLFVAAAASIGAYNHFVVLRSAPTDETEDSAVSGRLRRLVVAEAAILLLVIGVTAVLIQSNSGA